MPKKTIKTKAKKIEKKAKPAKSVKPAKQQQKTQKVLDLDASDSEAPIAEPNPAEITEDESKVEVLEPYIPSDDDIDDTGHLNDYESAFGEPVNDDDLGSYFHDGDQQ